MMSATSTLDPKTDLVWAVDREESRIWFRASWEFYEAFARELGGQHVLLAFDGEYIEIMSPGLFHERFKKRAGMIVPVLAGVLGLPCVGAGSTLWKSSKAQRGLEPDESYYLSPEKIATASALPRDAPAESFPYPDLAIEIDLSPSRIDRPGIYAALGVPEVWRLKRDAFTIECLDANGRFKAVKASPLLRISVEDLDHWILSQPLQDDNQFLAEFTAWARGVF